MFFAYLCLMASVQVHAAPPAAVQSAVSASTIYVTVPTKGTAATFLVGSKTWTVPAGKTVVLPAGAKGIYLPKGTVISASVSCDSCHEGHQHKHGHKHYKHYTIKKTTTLAGFNVKSFVAQKGNIQPGLHTYDATGAVTLPDYIKNNECCTHGDKGEIGLPTPTMAALIQAVLSASGRTVNPFNVLGEGVTDSN